MRKLLIGIVVVIVLIVVGIGIVLMTLDLNQFKPEIAAQVESATGRKLQIDGPIELDLGMSTALGVQGVKFANAEWGSRPNLAEIKEVRAVVSILPLLSGNIVVDQLQLNGADILLETNSEGVGNWVFDSAPAAESTTTSSEASGDAGALPSVNDVVVRDVALLYKDGVSGEEMTVKLDQVAVKDTGADPRPLNIDIAGSYNEAGFTLKGDVGDLAAVNSGAALPLDIIAEAFGIKIAADGAIAEPLTGNGIDLNLAVDAADLSGLAPVAGDGLPAGGPLQLTSAISGGAEAVSLKDLAFKFGELALNGNIDAKLDGPRPRINASLQSDVLDLRPLMPEGGGDGGDGAATEKSEASADRVFPDDPLPLDGLKAVDAAIDLAIGELITPNITVNDTKVNVTLENGNLNVDPFSLVVAQSALAGAIGLDGSGEAAKLGVNIQSEDFNIGQLLVDLGVTDLFEGSALIDLNVSGQGQSVAQIMGSLNGHSRVIGGQGRMRTQALDLLVGGLTQAISALSSDSEWTVVECIASDFKIESGVATSNVMLVDTEYASILGEGDINLGQEALNMKVSPEPKSATLNIALPIKVGGTFLQPSFAPDELAAARKLGGLLGAAFFPPAALAGLLELGGEDNPCVKTVQAGRQGEAAGDGGGVAGAAEKAVEKATESVGGGAKEALEDVGKGLKGLLGGD